MLVRLLILAVALVLVGGSAAAWWLLWSPRPDLPTLAPRTIRIGDEARSFRVFVPTQPASRRPLLIVLHGTGQDGDTIRHATGGRFDALGQQHGFAIAYPDGLDKQWNDCRPKEARLAAIDDVGFLAAMVDHLAESDGIDPQNVYLFGYSNGGQMVFRLLAERPAAYRAAATMGASLPTPAFNTCSFSAPTPPLLLAHGEKDPIVPYAGGKVSIFGVIDRGEALSAEETAADFAARNAADSLQADQLAPDIARWRWSGPQASQVERLAFAGAGHVVPQPLYRFPRIMGPTPSFDLPQYAVGFLGLGAR